MGVVDGVRSVMALKEGETVTYSFDSCAHPKTLGMIREYCKIILQHYKSLRVKVPEAKKVSLSILLEGVITEFKNRASDSLLWSYADILELILKDLQDKDL